MFVACPEYEYVYTLWMHMSDNKFSHVAEKRKKTPFYMLAPEYTSF